MDLLQKKHDSLERETAEHSYVYISLRIHLFLLTRKTISLISDNQSSALFSSVGVKFRIAAFVPPCFMCSFILQYMDDTLDITVSYRYISGQIVRSLR